MWQTSGRLSMTLLAGFGGFLLSFSGPVVMWLALLLLDLLLLLPAFLRFASAVAL